MSVPTTTKPNWIIAIGFPFFLCIVCYLITFTSKFKENTEILSNGVLGDLLITVPLVYFLAIRKSNIPKITIAGVFIVCILIAGFILKAHSNTALHIIETWIAPVMEGAVIFYIVRRFYIANKKAKQINNGPLDFLNHCRSLMFEVMGNEKVANIISSEIAMFYYSFIGGKDKTIDYKTKFTTYKENGVTLVLWLILSVFLIETAGMHFLLILWSKTIAWVVTALSLYTCIQLYGHIKAIKARPIKLNKDSLEIHNGLAGDAYIQFDNIERFELSKKIPLGQNAIKIALLKGFENHNIVVYLKKPIQVTKVFGIKKNTDTVLFYVDKAKDFSTAFDLALTN